MPNTSSARTPATTARRTFWAVIPAGGSGTRLWPLSRSTRPKFLLSLLGNRSLLQQTFDRLTLVTDPDRILVICGPAHAAAIARQLPELPSGNIIVEPAPNGTLPAIALAAALIARDHPTATMGSFAADHDVADPEQFAAAVETAIAASRDQSLVTIGLTPTRPETGYGYIERTDDVTVETSTGMAYRAAGFVEKPNLETAESYVVGGKHLWNASMFTWRVDAFLRVLRELQPEVHAGAVEIAEAWETDAREQVTARVWHSLPNVTVDRGIMELAKQVTVVPAEMGWSDVGDWNGLGELIEQDALGNSVRGELLQIDTTNSVIWSESGRMVAMIGLDNIIVVDTPDALLVIDREKSQEVRKVVDLLKAGMHHDLS